VSATRRLAAILAADVVGYSSLMGQDEAGTARAVRENREAAAPIVRGFGGRVVKTMGDGVLLEFPSVVAAVECAITIQQQMAKRGAGVPDAKRILYRIGVNLGDVLIEGEDILGDGVNIAARLEGICEPGAFASPAPPMTTFAAGSTRNLSTSARGRSRISPSRCACTRWGSARSPGRIRRNPRRP
jgi:class 3 adenylate cyclase